LLLLAALTAAAFGNWEELEPVPYGAEAGAGIVFGADSIWGVFPVRAEDMTGFAVFSSASEQWRQPPNSTLEYLENTALSFQSQENGTVFLIGNKPGESPELLGYDLARRSWRHESDVRPPFLLGPGASMTYVPNRDYRPLCAVPGWLYCLPGDPDSPRQFWRYSIPTSLGPQAVEGIHPGEGAVIADMTPLFIWPSAPGQPGVEEEYRLMVATETAFVSPLLNVQTSESLYQPDELLPNGTIYWRTAYRNAKQQWVWGDVHSFTLQGGWIRLSDIPTPIGAGAALAYEDDYFDMFVDGRHCLIALVGGDRYQAWRYMRAYDIWVGLMPTEVEQKPGSALATHVGIFGQGHGKKPKAVFGSNLNAWCYNLFHGWRVWEDAHRLPELPGPGASLAYSLDNYVYLVVGENEEGNPRDGFWRHYAPSDDEGERLSSQGSPAGSTTGIARVMCSADRVGLEYHLAAAGRVRVSVHDALGRRKASLFSGIQPAGIHQVSWDLRGGGTKVVPGTYFVLLDVGQQQTRFKVVVR